MVTVKQIFEYLNEVMPFDTQEKWDNSGLMLDSGVPSDKILCCLDVTKAAVDMAIETGCKIIVSHHPLIFSGIKSINSSSVIFKLIQNNISVVSAHTNFDKYENGTSVKLAEICGIVDNIHQKEFAVIADLSEEQDFDDFLYKMKEKFKNNIQFVKSSNNITKVMVVAGSGKGMTDEIIAENCDCLITGESSYHDMLDMKEMGINCICVGHDESEKISVSTLEELIEHKFENIQTICFIEKCITEVI